MSPHILRLPGVAGALFCAAAAWLGGCAQNLGGEAPPDASLYYPVDMAASSDGAHVYVVNSNFDLRYNAGWLSVVDVAAALAAGAPTDGASAGVVSQLKVPSLAGALTVSPDDDLAILSSRGGQPLTIVNIDGAAIDCGDPEATSGLSTVLRRADCDQAHLVSIDADNFEADSVEEADVEEGDLADPLSIQIFRMAGTTAPAPLYAAVSYLTSGHISLFDVTPGADEVLKHFRLIFTGRNLVSSLHLFPSVDNTRLVATGTPLSGAGSSLFDIDIDRSLADGVDRSRRIALSPTVGGIRSLDVAFHSNGSRAYAINNSPDSVVVLDTTITRGQELNDDGTHSLVARPAYNIVGAFSLNGRPTAVTYVDRPTDPLVVVSSFDDDALFFFVDEGHGLRLVRRMHDIGQGPHRLLPVAHQGRTLLLVTTFFDHSLQILDLTATDPELIDVVARVHNATTKPAESRF